MFRNRLIAIAVLSIAVILFSVGGVFLGVSIPKNNYVATSLRAQQVTLGLTQQQISAGKFVDNAQEAQVAAQTFATHLKSIAPNYGALTVKNSSGKFDPTNPVDVDYAQGLNLENSMNMAVLGFGVVQETMITGIVIMVIGLAIGGVGSLLFRYECSIPQLIVKPQKA
jgi:hypothetical protein